MCVYLLLHPPINALLHSPPAFFCSPGGPKWQHHCSVHCWRPGRLCTCVGTRRACSQPCLWLSQCCAHGDCASRHCVPRRGMHLHALLPAAASLTMPPRRPALMRHCSALLALPCPSSRGIAEYQSAADRYILWERRNEMGAPALRCGGSERRRPHAVLPAGRVLQPAGRLHSSSPLQSLPFAHPSLLSRAATGSAALR